MHKMKKLLLWSQCLWSLCHFPFQPYIVVVGAESVAVVVVAVEYASSSFTAVLVVGALVVVVLSAVESVSASFSAVVVVCCCITAESVSSSFSVIFVIRFFFML